MQQLGEVNSGGLRNRKVKLNLELSLPDGFQVERGDRKNNFKISCDPKSLSQSQVLMRTDVFPGCGKQNQGNKNQLPDGTKNQQNLMLDVNPKIGKNGRGTSVLPAPCPSNLPPLSPDITTPNPCQPFNQFSNSSCRPQLNRDVGNLAMNGAANNILPRCMARGCMPACDQAPNVDCPACEDSKGRGKLSTKDYYGQGVIPNCNPKKGPVTTFPVNCTSALPFNYKWDRCCDKVLITGKEQRPEDQANPCPKPKCPKPAGSVRFNQNLDIKQCMPIANDSCEMEPCDKPNRDFIFNVASQFSNQADQGQLDNLDCLKPQRSTVRMAYSQLKPLGYDPATGTVKDPMKVQKCTNGAAQGFLDYQRQESDNGMLSACLDEVRRRAERMKGPITQSMWAPNTGVEFTGRTFGQNQDVNVARINGCGLGQSQNFYGAKCIVQSNNVGPKCLPIDAVGFDGNGFGQNQNGNVTKSNTQSDNVSPDYLPIDAVGFAGNGFGQNQNVIVTESNTQSNNVSPNYLPIDAVGFAGNGFGQNQNVIVTESNVQSNNVSPDYLPIDAVGFAGRGFGQNQNVNVTESNNVDPNDLLNNAVGFDGRGFGQNQNMNNIGPNDLPNVGVDFAKRGFRQNQRVNIAGMNNVDLNNIPNVGVDYTGRSFGRNQNVSVTRNLRPVINTGDDWNYRQDLNRNVGQPMQDAVMGRLRAMQNVADINAFGQQQAGDGSLGGQSCYQQSGQTTKIDMANDYVPNVQPTDKMELISGDIDWQSVQFPPPAPDELTDMDSNPATGVTKIGYLDGTNQFPSQIGYAGVEDATLDGGDALQDTDMEVDTANVCTEASTWGAFQGSWMDVAFFFYLWLCCLAILQLLKLGSNYFCLLS